MFRIFTLLLCLGAAPALAAPGIAVEASPETKLFAELSIVGLVVQGQLEVFDAIALRPQSRPQFTVVFDRVGPLMRVRVLDEKSRSILSQFVFSDSGSNAQALRGEARGVAARVLAATEGHIALN